MGKFRNEHSVVGVHRHLDLRTMGDAMMSWKTDIERMKRDNLHIIVPTRGRVNVQTTLGALPKKWLRWTRIVCPSNEAKQLKAQFPDAIVWEQPDPNMSIADKRAWIFKQCNAMFIEKILMIDDDIRFSLRTNGRLDQFRGYDSYNKENRDAWAKLVKKDPGYHSLLGMEPNDPELDNMFSEVETMLCFFEHGGIHPRQMNQHNPGQWKMNARAMYALAFNVSAVLKHCELGRIQHREDMDYTLQLMRKGFPNCLYTWACANHYSGYGNRQGGTSDERSIKASNADAIKLAKLHPGIVKVVDKQYSTSVDRKEVIVSWQSAINAGSML